MPVLDGLAATRLIRESETGGKHTPIIAMTAYALQGDAKRCLEAGMDDYISKPLNPTHVFEVIQAWTGGVTDKGKLNKSARAEGNPDEAAPVLDFEEALPRFDGEMNTYLQFLTEFIQIIPETYDRMRSELRSGNLLELSNLAHNLKGVSATLGARQLSNLAFILDHQCRENQLVSADQSIGEMKLAIERFIGEAERLFRMEGFSGSTNR